MKTNKTILVMCFLLSFAIGWAQIENTDDDVTAIVNSYVEDYRQDRYAAVLWY